MKEIYFFENKKRPFIHKKNNKVLKISDYHKNLVKKEVIDIITSLEEDYNIICTISDSQLDYILDCFYQYYVEKEITYSYVENMLHHFRDMEIDVIESKRIFDVNFVLQELRLYELLESRVEVNPQDTKKMVQRLTGIFQTGRIIDGK